MSWTVNGFSADLIEGFFIAATDTFMASPELDNTAEQQHSRSMEHFRTCSSLHQETHNRALNHLRHYQIEKQRRRQEVFGTGGSEVKTGRICHERPTLPELNHGSELSHSLERMHRMYKSVISHRANRQSVGRCSEFDVTKYGERTQPSRDAVASKVDEAMDKSR